jgi:hypothetical protein
VVYAGECAEGAAARERESAKQAALSPRAPTDASGRAAADRFPSYPEAPARYSPPVASSVLSRPTPMPSHSSASTTSAIAAVDAATPVSTPASARM